MAARSLGRPVALAATIFGLCVFACSGGDDSSSAAGAAGAAGSTNPDTSCRTAACFRPIECVERCGGPVVQSGCCPCADGTLDQLVECDGGGEAGSTSSVGGSGNGGAGTGNDAGGGNPGGAVGTGGSPAGGAGDGVAGGGGDDGVAGTGSGGAPGAEPDLTQLGSPCVGDACPPGLTPVEYYGFAGPGGPLFCSCEIQCEGGPQECPPTTTCVVVSDGPGAVCILE